MEISYDLDIDKALAIMQNEAMNHPYFYEKRSYSEIHRGDSAIRAKVIGFGESVPGFGYVIIRRE